MKKGISILLKILIGFILLVVLLIFTIPVLFKDKIKARVEQAINGSVNAKVNFKDYKLVIFKNFPNLTFSLKDLTLSGVEKFELDTLAGFKSMDLVFNLSSLFRKTGYEIKSVNIDRASVKALVLKDGSANWDIMKETGEASASGTSSPPVKILLQKIDILNSSVSYIDHESDIETYLKGANFNINGNMTLNETNLHILIKADEVTFIMDGVKYLDKAKGDSKINVLANLDSMRFDLKENYLQLNDMKLNFAGMVAMPGDDIKTDLTFNSQETSFKSLLSIIPSFYKNDFKDLKTSGEFIVTGSAKGVYSDADSTMPDILLNLQVKNGLVSYPALPEQIKNINLKSDIYIAGKNMDLSTVNVNGFHFELAGNPFDIAFALRTPESDPDFEGSMNGKIDLAALSKALPMDSINLSGIINMSVNLAARMSMIEKAQYDKVRASGNMNIEDMLVSMTGYPDVKIIVAGFEFSPKYAALKQADLIIDGKNDFSLNGKLENYLPYVFKKEVMSGNLSMHSKFVDLNGIMSKLASDTTKSKDTTSLALIKVPGNIDFNFDALIDQFTYNKIKVNNVRGHLIIKDGILSLKETDMDLLGGTIRMNAEYDTRDSLKPSVKADLNIERLGVKDAFNTFNTIQKLAPTAKGIDGKVGVKLSFSSLLGHDFMPVVQTISGGGKLVSSEVTLLNSAVYNKMKEVLKLGSNYSNTFKDLNISFKINDGRIYVSPFDVKAGNIKMNISGDQGIDQTINYFVKTQIPRSDLGSSINSLIDNFSAQASAFGFSFKPADLIKVNVKVTGTFLKPVVTPVFGRSPSDSTKSIRETAGESLKQVVDEGVEKAREKARIEAQQEGDKLVQEAEEKGQQLRDEAVKAAEKIRKEADLQAQKLIKDAEGKNAFLKIASQKAADSINKEANKRAGQLVNEADEKARQLVEAARAKRDELIKKI